MPLLEHIKNRVSKAIPARASFVQEKERAGLLVTNEFDKALQECQLAVARIARDCRSRNRKFRDIEFDLENDRDRCLHGLYEDDKFKPSDVQRITQIFDNPQFFIGGAHSNDIVQGSLGDCWFLSALATMATYKGLVEKFCVARDEQVGVYGFIFFRDGVWVVTIIDDLLFTLIPKYEELSTQEKQLYHNDKDQYNHSARKGGKTLFFAKSGTQGETWVALIEKAFAKLHGDYSSLGGGMACEAIEDLTGGVCSIIKSKDILDIDQFWREELLLANHDRVFGCSFKGLDGTRSGIDDIAVNGLIGSHAYSVLRVVEYKGKRFVVIRNPWGQSEWTGPWSDGSKEWTQEWLKALPHLGHSFGDDGQFIMEYSDFLANWEIIERTRLFDSSWVMSSQWLNVTSRSPPCAWTYGDVSFTFSLPKRSFTIIVLSKLDDRYFTAVSRHGMWTFDFVLFRRGNADPVASSAHSIFWARSVNLEIDLDAGDYVVHVRLDRESTNMSPGNERKLSRVLMEKTKSQSIASNFNADSNAVHIPMSLKILGGHDLLELEQQARETAAASQAERDVQSPLSVKTAIVETSPDQKSIPLTAETKSDEAEKAETDLEVEDGQKASDTTTLDDVDNGEDEDEDKDFEDAKEYNDRSPFKVPDTMMVPDLERTPLPSDSDNSIFLGLRVYTCKDAPVVVGGQLRHEMNMSSLGSGLATVNGL